MVSSIGQDMENSNAQEIVMLSMVEVLQIIVLGTGSGCSLEASDHVDLIVLEDSVLVLTTIKCDLYFEFSTNFKKRWNYKQVINN